MSSEKKQITKNTRVEKQDEERDAEGVGQPKGSFFGALVRGGLILALILYMLKPYLFDKPEVEEGVPQTFIIRGETMGTTWNALVCASPQKLLEINNEKYSAANSSQVSQEGSEIDPINSCEGLLASIIQGQVDKVDAVASTYRADSEISRFNHSRETEWFPVSLETAQIVQLALDVASETKGAFDVTVAPLVNMYRFGPNKSPLVSFPTDEEIANNLAKVGYDKLEARLEPEPGLRKAIPELTIDLSGIAKGFAVDLVCDKLEEYGLNDYMIEVGGEICCRGNKIDSDNPENRVPWTLGIQSPEVVLEGAAKSERTPDIYRLLHFDPVDIRGVLATSGDYNNFLQIGSTRFSHIVDPRTGKPTELVEDADFGDNVERLGSVSVVSTRENAIGCARADAYATAFFVLGETEGVPLADELGLALLYLYRSDDSATQLREAPSRAFSQGVDSKTVEEFMQKDSEENKDSEQEEESAETIAFLY